MPPESDPLARALGLILSEVQGWPGVTLGPHRFGGTEFRLARGEIGHVHPDGLLDVPFPKPVRDELVANHRAEAHHVLPRSGWVSYRLRTEADVPHALELLRLAYEVRRTRTEPGLQPESGAEEAAESEESPSEEALDEAIEESFPASDPPAVSHIDRAHR